jgi:hypothetical protein
MVGTKFGILLITLALLPALSKAQTIHPPKAETQATEPAAKPAAKAKTKKPSASAAAAVKPQTNILFEGWSKVILGGVHVGYVVQRYEFDPKKKQFIGAYFLKTNQLAGSVTESLKARADSGLKPISYQYTELVAGKTKTIDANINGETLVANVQEADKPPVTIRKNFPKGTFLSTFLVYTMLSAKDGIHPGARYVYNAIAEEDAGVYPGEATVVANEDSNGISAMKVFNTFKNVKFVSYITNKGEILSTRSPVQSIATELVATKEEAIGAQQFTSTSVAALFGEVPQGKMNPVAMKAASQPAQATTTTTTTTEPEKKTEAAAPQTAPAASPTNKE